MESVRLSFGKRSSSAVFHGEYAATGKLDDGDD